MQRRVFWLLMLALLGWLIWRRLHMSANSAFGDHPQLAPSLPPDQFAPHLPPLTPSPAPVPPAPAASDGRAQPAAPAAAPTTELIDDAPVGEAELADDVPVGEAELADDVPVGEAEPASDAAEPGESEQTAIVGYCVRCKAKRELQQPHIERTEKGRMGARGTCPVCGGNMFTFLKDDAAATLQDAEAEEEAGA